MGVPLAVSLPAYTVRLISLCLELHTTGLKSLINPGGGHSTFWNFMDHGCLQVWGSDDIALTHCIEGDSDLCPLWYLCPRAPPLDLCAPLLGSAVCFRCNALFSQGFAFQT